MHEKNNNQFIIDDLYKKQYIKVK